jgi:hypothetical protein
VSGDIVLHHHHRLLLMLVLCAHLVAVTDAKSG